MDNGSAQIDTHTIRGCIKCEAIPGDTNEVKGICVGTTQAPTLLVKGMHVRTLYASGGPGNM